VAAVQLYRRILGTDFDKLPKALRRFHDLPEGGCGRGRFHVERGRGLFARILASVFRFPEAGTDVPVVLRIAVEGDRERWTRNFGTRTLQSVQWCHDGLLIEQMKLARFAIQLSADETGMRFFLRRTWLLMIPLPGFLAPQIETSALAYDDGWQLIVSVSFPWAGPVLLYHGIVTPET
jgi:hypothetical protein